MLQSQNPALPTRCKPVELQRAGGNPFRLGASRAPHPHPGCDEVTVDRLGRAFTAVDTDGSGSIEILELLMYCDIERTAFTLRAFAIMDADGSGEIDFGEPARPLP